MRTAESWYEVGEKVREARTIAGLTQQAVSERLGIDRSAVARIEAGERSVSALELFRLSDLFDVPLGYFVATVPESVISRRAVVVDRPDAAGRAAWRLDVALDEHGRDATQLLRNGLLPDPDTSVVPSPSDTAPIELATRARAHLGLGIGPVGDLAEVLERFALYLLVTDHDADGASMIVGNTLGVAVVGGARDPGRRRLTAAHELGHHLIGDAYHVDVGTTTDERERTIDAFAREFLLPRGALMEGAPDPEDPDALRRHLVGIAGRYRVSWSVVVLEARSAGLLDGQRAQRLRASPPVDGDFLAVLGRRPAEDLRTGTTGPGWRRAVVDAYGRALVTGDRAVELLHGLIDKESLPTRKDEPAP